MRKIHYLIIACLFLLLSSPALAQQQKKNVLYLNSYHHGYEWSDNILDGVRSILDESEYKIDLQIEYMDAKKFNYEDVTGMLLRLYLEKFDGEDFDVVMVSDNDAFAFASQYRDVLFPHVPLVFCGVNDLKEDALSAGDITGVVENFDLMLTLDVAMKLHPGRDHMVVVGDESTAGVAIRRQIEAIMPHYEGRLSVEYWSKMGLEDVQKKAQALTEDTFLFFIPYYQTLDGQFFTAEEVMHSIYAHTKVPIYTAWQFLLGNGALGGRLLSGFKHGQVAASMALRILEGESVADIPVYTEPTGEYSFDYNVMRRLGVDAKQLPEGSVILNAPKAFYELPKELFWTIITMLFILSVVMVFLVSSMVERRKVEHKIKDQLAFQETLMDAVPHLVSWKDVGGRFLGTNKAFAEFFGFKDNMAIMSKTTDEVMKDIDYAEWSKEVDAAVVDSHQEYLKVRRKLTDARGNKAWVEVNKVPIRDQSGRVVGVLSTAENITKERNLEKQLLQSQKMEAIGTLAGGIAHDFNNILTSIINSTELAVGDVDPDSVTSKDLKRVLKAARRGGRVVKQILAFSRPSTEGFRSTDLGAIVSEVLGLMEASMPGNISVHAHIQSPLPCVHADPTQLHQVAMNLCTNSFHALRDRGGVIEASVEVAQLKQGDAVLLGLDPGEYVRMTIEDNGPGIPPDIVDKIFDPFFSTKDKTEGTGLGLAVVHGIVHSHKGGMQVFPRPGGGTVFELYLPKSDGEGGWCALAGSGAAFSGAHILFVEDDEDQLVTTPRLLRNMGYEVTAEREPERAVKRVAVDPDQFDLIITDWDMPGMSGTQMAIHMAELAPDLPMVLVSGREDSTAAALALPNIRQVVIKPYDKDDLTAVISSVLATG